MKTILITGSSGFIGEYLTIKFKQDYNIIGIDLSDNHLQICNKFYQGDISDLKFLSKIFNEYKIDLVIHTAAIKSLSSCEDNKKLALNINYDATKNLYLLCKTNNTKLIYISSDQVFYGDLGNYKENDKKVPINYYGQTKSMCEDYLITKPTVTICRTALVFGKVPINQAELFNNIKEKDHIIVQGFIVEHIKERLQKNLPIYLTNDEFCNPTSTNLLYRQIKKIIDLDLSGIIHCCGRERIDRYKFGIKIASILNLDSNLIFPVKSIERLRPKDVSMSIAESEAKLQMKFDNIQQMLVIEKENKHENL
jgi:dTDP-4-dehydrorhamnose reductase